MTSITCVWIDSKIIQSLHYKPLSQWLRRCYTWEQWRVIYRSFFPSLPLGLQVLPYGQQSPLLCLNSHLIINHNNYFFFNFNYLKDLTIPVIRTTFLEKFCEFDIFLRFYLTLKSIELYFKCIEFLNFFINCLSNEKIW
jgi:hypothetical protein